MERKSVARCRISLKIINIHLSNKRFHLSLLLFPRLANVKVIADDARVNINVISLPLPACPLSDFY